MKKPACICALWMAAYLVCAQVDLNSPVAGIFNRSSTGLSVPTPTGWWKLTETNGTVANDSSGNGNNGTLVGGPVWAKPGIIINHSATDYVGLTNSAGTVPSQFQVNSNFTISAWIIETNSGAFESIFGAPGSTTGEINFFLQQSGGGHNIGIQNQGIGTIEFNSTGLIPANTNLFVAVTFTASTVILYTNGVAMPGGGSAGGGSAFTFNNWTIGAGWSGQNFNGLIRDCRFWTNTVLSASQITLLYQNGPAN